MPDSALLYKEIRTHPGNPGFEVWCDWALAEANRIDPVLSRSILYSLSVA
jgi:hypothetical protein